MKRQKSSKAGPLLAELLPSQFDANSISSFFEEPKTDHKKALPWVIEKASRRLAPGTESETSNDIGSAQRVLKALRNVQAPVDTVVLSKVLKEFGIEQDDDDGEFVEQIFREPSRRTDGDNSGY